MVTKGEPVASLPSPVRLFLEATHLSHLEGRGFCTSLRNCGMMSSPGNPLEVTSALSEVNPRCGAKVSSPSRPQEAKLPVAAQTKGPKSWGGAETALTCRAWGQSGYVRLELAAPRLLPKGSWAVG